jgi:uncharacterized protein YodC (DUF2158 family)
MRDMRLHDEPGVRKNGGKGESNEQVQERRRGLAYVGGPKMTINDTPETSGENYQCQWFAGNKLESGWFPEKSLIVPKPAKDKEE